MAKRSKQSQIQARSMDEFAQRCAAGLEALLDSQSAQATASMPAYGSAIRYILRMLAILSAAEHIPSGSSSSTPVIAASRAILDAAAKPDDGFRDAYEQAAQAAHGAGGIDIFAPLPDLVPDPDAFSRISRILLSPPTDAPIKHVDFQAIPLSWLGGAYQHLLALRAGGPRRGLEPDRTRRKNAGVYFTPSPLVRYVIESVLTPLIEATAAGAKDAGARDLSSAPRLLDPAMGGGDFLTCAIDFLCESAAFAGAGQPADVRARIAAGCVYGVDVDPMAVDVSRFCVWAASGYADGVSEAIRSHLICADVLGGSGPPVNWSRAFAEVFAGSGGFDAVVGNPPYIASKNGLGGGRSGRSGQSDSYLMFLSSVIDNNLVAPDGFFSMVLPDPMLVRDNAADVRCKLASDWTILSILHISRAFADANVANLVAVCRNAPAAAPAFAASRVERVADRRRFNILPRETAEALAHPVRLDMVRAQPRCKFLYLLEQDGFRDVVHRIHGEDAALSNYEPPFVPLREINVRAVYRGEEIGKAAIAQEEGSLPILLGGQSIRQYEILWEGRRIDPLRVRKPLERYARSKILVQKSSARLIAALDTVSRRRPGYVFPQSVYAIELQEPGMHHLYLLCILNSEVINEYVWRTVTGYKLLQPQLELEDIRALPIRRIRFTTPAAEREADLARAIGIYDDESLRSGERGSFPQLADFVDRRLTDSPERSDVVHDLLVHLGRLMVELARSNRKSPDAGATRRLESTRAAIETVVWRLYSSQPPQMELRLSN